MTMNYDALERTVTDHMVDAYDMYCYGKKRLHMTKLIAAVIAASIIGLISSFGLFFVITEETRLAAISIIATVSVLTVLFTIVAYTASVKSLRTSVRLWSLTSDNKNIHYWPKTDDPMHSGMLFSLGDSRRALDQLFSTSGIIYEFGNYEYTTGSGKSRTSHANGYISIDLGRHLPNMVLDAKRNNVSFFGANLSNLPVSFKKDQILSLEGDFNEHFTLYAPKEYERDALYVFTPDLMALLIDEVYSFDAEIVDNKLYIYSATNFDLSNRGIIERIFRIIDVVGAKAISQSENYSDERVGNRSIDAVAVGGKRLRKGIPWVVIIVVTIIFLTQIAIGLGKILE